MLNDFDHERKENHTGYVKQKGELVITVYYLYKSEQERDQDLRVAPGTALSFPLLLSLNLPALFHKLFCLLLHSSFSI